MYIEYIIAALLFLVPLTFYIYNRRKKSAGCDCSTKSERNCSSCPIPTSTHLQKYVDENYPKH